MLDAARLNDILTAATFGGIGIALALALVLAAYVLLGSSERRHLRMPTVFLVLHAALVVAEVLLPESVPIHRPIRILAIALLLLSMARSGFLLVVHVIVGRRGNSPLPKILQDILQGLFYAAVALVVLRSAGVEPGSLLTTSALLTAVIGLSLQETLGNLFAGLAIQAQAPFEVGDWIQLGSEPGLVGRVVEINWRATRLVTNDNVEITMPNGALARASITNFSRPTRETRRAVTIVADVTVPPGHVQRVLLDAVRGAPGVLEQPAPDVVTLGFNERGVEYKIRYWMSEFDRRDPIDGAVRDRLWYALQRAGLSVPPAQRHVFVHSTSKESIAEQQASNARDRVRALRNIDFLREVPEESMESLAVNTQRRMYTAGETVLREGSEGEELFLVQSGEVEILVGAGQKNEARIASLGVGRFFGEMSVMTGEKRRATVRAVRETVLLVVSRQALAPILEAHPAIAQRISEVLAERELALSEQKARSEKEHKSIVEQRSDALLVRIRQFFSL